MKAEINFYGGKIQILKIWVNDSTSVHLNGNLQPYAVFWRNPHYGESLPLSEVRKALDDMGYKDYQMGRIIKDDIDADADVIKMVQLYKMNEQR